MGVYRAVSSIKSNMHTVTLTHGLARCGPLEGLEVCSTGWHVEDKLYIVQFSEHNKRSLALRLEPCGCHQRSLVRAALLVRLLTAAISTNKGVQAPCGTSNTKSLSCLLVAHPGRFLSMQAHLVCQRSQTCSGTWWTRVKCTSVPLGLILALMVVIMPTRQYRHAACWTEL
jgi:hypothetical protein